MNVFPVDSVVTGLGTDGLPKYDRSYKASDLRDVLAEFFTNGVFGEGQLAVSANSTQGVAVAPGSCIINGAMGVEGDPRTLVLQAADPSLDRIDTVVVRLDLSIDQRTCDLYVVQGTPAAEPERPALTRNETVWELGLADVYVRTGTTTVSTERITDTRPETERCGFASPFAEIDTTAIFNQLNAATQSAISTSQETVEQSVAEIEAAKEQAIASTETAIDGAIDELEQATQEAVEAMKGALDGTTAGSLQSAVEELREGKADAAHTHDASDIISGALAIERGGTGATTAYAALQALGVTIGEEEAPATGTPNPLYIQMLPAE